MESAQRRALETAGKAVSASRAVLAAVVGMVNSKGLHSKTPFNQWLVQ
jgi:hypothetical protein